MGPPAQSPAPSQSPHSPYPPNPTPPAQQAPSQQQQVFQTISLVNKQTINSIRFYFFFFLKWVKRKIAASATKTTRYIYMYNQLNMFPQVLEKIQSNAY